MPQIREIELSTPKPIPLNERNLGRLPSAVRVPTYDRRGVTESMLHIGVGAFFRAHQAVYLDHLLHRPGHAEWGYCGVGLLDNDAHMRDALLPQNCLYTVVERSAAGDRPRVIGSLLNYLHARRDPEKVLETMASSKIRIVSLTITEGGYYINEGTGDFNDAHPDIVHDLENPHWPKCSFGFIVEALARRRARGLEPFTVMPCDNLERNGDVAKRMILAFAERRDPALAAWLSDYCAFPNSMVDRITPVTTDEHRALLRNKFGLEDAWPIVTEPFTQWVIEDNFPGGRPKWEDVGVQITANLAPYEKTKMRLLNASHQAVCYVGMLLGHQYAHEALEDARILMLIRRMMDLEITPLLTPPAGIDLGDYKKTLIERFSNPTIRDQLSRISTDGSARIPKFVLSSISEALSRGGPIKLLSFTVAAWFRFLTGTDDRGRKLPINDSMAETLQEHARRGGRNPEALLELREVFGEELARNPVFVNEVRAALASFYDKGTEATLTEFADGLQ